VAGDERRDERLVRSSGQHEKLLYRLFVRLGRDPPGLPHHTIVADGDAKKSETAFSADFYASRREQWEIYARMDPRSVE
jgi:hypothetical protein